MGPWQTGMEGVWSLAGKVGSLEGGTGGARKDPGLNGQTVGEEMGRKSEKNEEKRNLLPS